MTTLGKLVKFSERVRKYHSLKFHLKEESGGNIWPNSVTEYSFKKIGHLTFLEIRQPRLIKSNKLKFIKMDMSFDQVKNVCFDKSSVVLISCLCRISLNIKRLHCNITRKRNLICNQLTFAEFPFQQAHKETN